MLFADSEQGWQLLFAAMAPWLIEKLLNPSVHEICSVEPALLKASVSIQVAKLFTVQPLNALVTVELCCWPREIVPEHTPQYCAEHDTVVVP